MLQLINNVACNSRPHYYSESKRPVFANVSSIFKCRYFEVVQSAILATFPHGVPLLSMKYDSMSSVGTLSAP